jgi:hypothetical protein
VGGQVRDVIVQSDVCVIHVIYVFQVVVRVFLASAVSTWFCVIYETADWVASVYEVADSLGWLEPIIVFVAA